MLKKAFKIISVLVLLQVVVIAVLLLFTEQSEVLHAQLRNSLESSGKASVLQVHDSPTAHYSHDVEVEGEAETSDLASCMSTINQTLAVLPENHVEALEKLILIFDEEAKRGQAGGTLMKLRCADVTTEELAAVLIHEMGHIVDIGMLVGTNTGLYDFVDGERPVWSDDLSATFYEISWVSNDEWAEDTAKLSFVSRYADSDPFEDFAESYVYYVLQGDAFRTLSDSNEDIAAKYEFMRDYVFEGIEYSEIGQHEVLLFERPYDVTLLNYNLEYLWGSG